MDQQRPWVPFSRWLEQQGSMPAPRDAAAPVQGEEPAQLSPADSPRLQRQQHPRPPAAPAAAAGRPRPRGVQPTAPDCRAEQRLLEGYLVGGRQELSLMLAAPGLPAHRAPVVTANQATAMLRAISEPLVQLEVGRLTRHLSSPTKLQPTGERGVLSLWLLPNGDVTLTWQATLPAPAAAPQPPLGAAAQQPDAASGAAVGGQQVASNVAVWEALAHFPESCFYNSDEPVAVIHTLRNDPSGRSFYIRPRADIAAHTAEQTAELQQAADGASGAGPSPATPLPPPGAEAPGLPRMYFWLRGRDLEEGMHALGRLKSLLRRPPSLAKRAGVPQKKLEQVGAWLIALETHMQQQQQQQQEAATAAIAQSGLPKPPSPATSLGMLLGRGAGPSPALASARMAAALSAVVSCSHAAPLAGLAGALGPGALPPSSRAALPPGLASPQPRAPMSGTSTAAAGGGGSSEGSAATASSTVSASASAVYLDRRFNLMAPVAVTVVATSLVEGSAGVDPAAQQQAAAGLQSDAVGAASSLAQQQAQVALESSGRRVMEEQLAEAVISTIKASRSSGRAQRAAQRAQERDQEAAEARRWQTALAMPKIRAAAIRAGRGRRCSAAAGGAAAPPLASTLRPCLPAAPAAGNVTPPARIPCAVPPQPPPLAACRVEPGGGFALPRAAAAEPAAAPTPPATLRRRRPASPSPPATEAEPSRKVTLTDLQSLLSGSEPSSSEDGQAACHRELQPGPGSEAGSEPSGCDAEKGPPAPGDGSPRKVSLGGLFKLINGCLDV